MAAVALAAGISAVAGASGATHSRVAVESGGFTYVSSAQSAAGGYVELSVDCPGDLHVWGGGEDNSAGYDNLTLRQSHPMDDGDADQKPDDGWTVGVDTAASQDVTVQAVCAKPKPKYVEQDEELFPTNQGFFKVKCPRGTNVSSGGVSGPQLIVSSSSFPPTEISWGLEIDNYTPVGNETPFTAYAVCPSRDLTSAPQDVMVRSVHVPMPATTGTKKARTCKNGRRVVGGGWNTTGTLFETTGNRSAFKGDTKWVSTADNTSAGERVFGAFALCSVPID